MRRKRFFRRAVYEHPEHIYVPERDPSRFRAWFDERRQNAPFTLELGMGAGDFLVEKAALYPERFFLGVEIKPDRVYRAFEKAREKGLQNMAFLQTAVERLPEYALPVVDELFVLFPDPWPKLRHSPRRMTSPGFLRLYQQLLADEGSLKLKTDNLPLFDYSIEVLQQERWQLQQVDRHFVTDVNLQTGFERKFLRQGLPIHYLVAQAPLSRKSFRKMFSGLLHSFSRS